jgi:hypothetical protein
VGDYAFTASFSVVGPAATVVACGGAVSAGIEIASDCDEVQVYEDDTDTTVEIDKSTTVTTVAPGAALRYTITLTNPGPNPADPQNPIKLHTTSPLRAAR